MRKTISVVLVFFMFLNLAGCASLQKKFTRKKKETVRMPRIYQVKKYEKKPSLELYQKHYAYWESWHSELVTVLGQNRRKDKRCIEELTGQLYDMRNLLVPEKAKALEAHIEKIARVKDTIFNEDLTQFNKDSVLMTLDREERLVRKDFSPGKVRNYIIKSFEGEPSPS